MQASADTHPVGLDQGDVVQQRADAVERSVGIPINHLRDDAVELTQAVAAAIFEGCQPTADLGIVRYRLESQSLLNRGRQSPKSFSDTSEPSRAWVRQTPIWRPRSNEPARISDPSSR